MVVWEPEESCPHRLAWSRTSALQAGNASSNLAGGTTHPLHQTVRRCDFPDFPARALAVKWSCGHVTRCRAQSHGHGPGRSVCHEPRSPHSTDCIAVGRDAVRWSGPPGSGSRRVRTARTRKPPGRNETQLVLPGGLRLLGFQGRKRHYGSAIYRSGRHGSVTTSEASTASPARRRRVEPRENDVYEEA